MGDQSATEKPGQVMCEAAVNCTEVGARKAQLAPL